MRDPLLQFLLLLATLFVAFNLRVYELTARSLWFDEAATFALIDRFTWQEMLHRIRLDVHPPLFYCALRAWTTLCGDSVFALRGLSVAWGVVTVVGAYLFGRDAFARTEHGTKRIVAPARATGVLAAALVAASTAQIRWSQEARMYAMGAGLAVLSSWLLLRALRNTRRSWLWWFGYTFCAASFLYTHYYALFTIAAQALFAAGCLVADRRQSGTIWRARSFWWSLASFGGLALLFWPWVEVLRQQAREVRADFWIGEIGVWNVPDAWFRLFFPANTQTLPPGLVRLAFSALLLAALVVFVRRGGRGRWLALLLVVVPTVCSLVVSLSMMSIVVSRYYLFAHVFMLAVLADLAVRSTARWKPDAAIWLRASAPAALLVGELVMHVHYTHRLDLANHPGARGAVAHVLERQRSDEPIVVLHPGIYFSVSYYAPDREAVRLYYPTGEIKHYYGRAMLRPEDIIGPSSLPQQPGSGVWVMSTTGFTRGFDSFSLPQQWKPVKGTRAVIPDAYHFQKVILIRLYQLRPASPDFAPG